MLIRVLIINRQLVFAVTIKQALEQTGVFEVHPFTDPSAATEYLRSHPHDAVLVDFSITVMQGPEIVKQLRAIQPDVAIVVSPAQPQALMRELDLQQSIDPPFSARSIIPVIEHAIQQKSQPLSAVTQTLVDSENPEAYDTEILTADNQNEGDDLPGQAGVSEPAQTRIFNDEGRPVEPSGTRLFDEGNSEEALQDRVTRMFDDNEDQAPAITHIFDNEPPDFVPTRQPDDSAATAPPGLPEFSSLDEVLNDEEPSGLYEPAVKDS